MVQILQWARKGPRYRWHAWRGHYLYHVNRQFGPPWCAIQRWYCTDCRRDI